MPPIANQSGHAWATPKLLRPTREPKPSRFAGRARAKRRPMKAVGARARAVVDASSIIARGKRVLEIEADAVRSLAERLGPEFAQAVALLLDTAGKVVVTGMGKSGLVGQKIAATMASTGTPALFLHPAEGLHGDLGVVGHRDLVVALSNSGETSELLSILPSLTRLGVPIVALVGKPDSTLGRVADVVLDVGVVEEACPLNLAPTASTSAALAMGDALAMALSEAKGFGEEGFALCHPGGALGRRLLMREPVR